MPPVIGETLARIRTWRHLGGVALVLLLSHGAAASESAPLLHPMFQDHAVLQRDVAIPVYGWAEPGTLVEVTLGPQQARVRADDGGQWLARLTPLPAGGPHRLVIEAGASRATAEDVLIGDVWLCSGQSNMVLQVHRSLDARAEIANGRNDRIRMLTVGETGSVSPLASFATPVQWRATTPESVADFSATCYYYARALQQQVDVPMGLLVAAWGGSRIQAWISAEALRARGHLDGELDALAAYASDPVAAAADWGRLWQRWWQSQRDHGDDQPWDPTQPTDAGWRVAPSELGAWEHWGVPELADYNGMLWYRSSVELTADQARQSATLVLGSIDEVDMSWVNGVGVGSAYGPGQNREYRLPDGLLQAGRNTVVINALDTYRDGGLAGPASAHALILADGSRVAFDQGWQWRPAGDGSPPRAPWHTAAGMSTLYNGMIAPIGRYGIRGFLWYQGESNTFEAADYGSLLSSLTQDWRGRFGADLPWLNVQLAGYGAAPTAPGESGWARLREVQRRHTELDPHYGIATAVDIGDRYDIHPPNKQELGRRLARLARHLIYGESDLAPSGPQPVTVRREGGAVVVRFSQVSDRLVVYGANRPIGFELCAPAVGQGEALECEYAEAALAGSAVSLYATNADRATVVRHAWADNPLINLFDGAGLPAQPFEMAISDASSEH
ncbi:MAG: sialate O-acetylesterase [Lysobacterales bacterium]